MALPLRLAGRRPGAAPRCAAALAEVGLADRAGHRPTRAVRRPAAAGRDRPRAGHPAGGALRRRADRRAGHRLVAAGAGLLRGLVDEHGQTRRHGHPRPGRGGPRRPGACSWPTAGWSSELSADGRGRRADRRPDGAAGGSACSPWPSLRDRWSGFVGSFVALCLGVAVLTAALLVTLSAQPARARPGWRARPCSSRPRPPVRTRTDSRRAGPWTPEHGRELAGAAGRAARGRRGRARPVLLRPGRRRRRERAIGGRAWATPGRRRRSARTALDRGHGAARRRARSRSTAPSALGARRSR